jgi:hypothetical protein
MYSTRHPCHILRELKFFSTDFRKKEAQTSNFMKIRPMGAELFHGDGQTDTPKLIVAFRNFTNPPQNPKSTLMWC